jgi:hypothetical protein
VEKEPFDLAATEVTVSREATQDLELPVRAPHRVAILRVKGCEDLYVRVLRPIVDRKPSGFPGLPCSANRAGREQPIEQGCLLAPPSFRRATHGFGVTPVSAGKTAGSTETPSAASSSASISSSVEIADVRTNSRRSNPHARNAVFLYVVARTER